MEIEVTLKAVGSLIESYVKSSSAGQTVALDQQAPEQIAKALNLHKVFEKGFRNQEELLGFITTYLKHTNHLRHPHYMGHQVAVPQDLSGIPELIHGSINNPSSLYEMGPAGATCEGFMINWMLDQIGWLNPQDYTRFEFTAGQSSGILTHGGSVANLTALAAARAKIAPSAWVEGNPNNLVVIGAASAHYSIGRALSILGLGKKAFYAVKVDANEVLLMQDLEKVYKQCVSEGKRVMCVVANACATSTGLFDPINAMGDFCKQYGLWFHVDGAHGASALLSQKTRQNLKGIEKATSIIWDAHKMLRVPSLCTAVLFKEFNDQAGAFQQKGSYVFHDNEVVGIDSMPYTIECTKSSLGFKLFWTFALEGLNPLIRYIENTFRLTQRFYTLLQNDKDFETPYAPESNILCFRYTKLGEDDTLQKTLRYRLINEKQYYITSCILNGKRYLRTVLINPDTSIEHLKGLIQAIKQEGNKMNSVSMG